jgi:hypothetical protein
MNTEQIAFRLVELCRTGEWDLAQKELYADDAVSIEPFATPEFEKETKGLHRIVDKGEKFQEMVKEMHSIEVSEPMIVPRSFAFVLTMDITMKGKNRQKMSELCVYEVRNGKIVSEHFFM